MAVLIQERYNCGLLGEPPTRDLYPACGPVAVADEIFSRQFGHVAQR